ncbi:MAG: hypothetical protein ACI4SF_10435 [Oscillospiraceae bacterium]
MKKAYINPEMNMAYFFCNNIVTTSALIPQQSGTEKVTAALDARGIEAEKIYTFTF